MAKEVEQADPVVLFLEKMKNYILENKNKVATVGSIVVLVIACAGYWKYTSVKVEQKSFYSLSKALTLLSKQVKTEEEKNKNNREALETFQKIAKKYSGTYAGLVALYYSGNCSLTLKNYAEAIEDYHRFLKKAGTAPLYLKTLAYEGLGYAYEGKGDYLKAAEWFEKQKSSAPEMSAALLNVARSYELAGDTKAACRSYRDLKKEFPSSPFIETADMKLGNLCQAVDF